MPPGNIPGFGAGGSSDFQSLFAGTSQWPTTSAHVSVIGLYAGWVTQVSPTTLAQTVAFLNAHNMAIELEAPSLQAPANCGSGIEGYVPYGQSLQTFTQAYLQALAAVNANVRYLKVDEPFYFGSVSNTGCQWSTATVAQAVAQFSALVHSINPNVLVGDVEPVIASAYTPDVATAMGQWHDAYKSASGAAFPFYISDNDFSNPQWAALALAMETEAHARGMQYGIIYTGDPMDASDQTWASKAVARFEAFQSAAGGSPDFVLFQSWMVHPTYCLPETTATTFTGVLDAYIGATTPAAVTRYRD